MNRAELAQKAQINLHTVSDIYHERRYPEGETLQKICNILRVQGSDIVQILPDPPPKPEMHGMVEGKN